MSATLIKDALEPNDRTAPFGFDPQRAQWPTRKVGCDQVIDLLEVAHAPERVEEYRQAMQRGELFPPIAVVRFCGRYLVADGHKRFTAYKSLRSQDLIVEVWPLRRWLSDQRRQFAQGVRRQTVTLLRVALGQRNRAEAGEITRHVRQHWSRILRSLYARFRTKRRS